MPSTDKLHNRRTTQGTPTLARHTPEKPIPGAGREAKLTGTADFAAQKRQKDRIPAGFDSQNVCEQESYHLGGTVKVELAGRPSAAKP
ncbi:MAG: hypothetical protein EBV34_20385 [Betaproteobacteria bacterium]|nr:hypothetical protein [Betaproteobacteria bacterium]NDE54797.1 hypothetical protein [Actinomycetota bacterium]